MIKRNFFSIPAISIICGALFCIQGCSQQPANEKKDSNKTSDTAVLRSKGVVVQPGDGEALVFRAPPVPDSVTVIISPKNGSERFAMGTQNLPVNYLVPVHKHEEEDEILYIDEGNAKATLGDKTVNVTKGTTIFIPHGTWHSIYNNSGLPGQMLWFVSKPGLEDFFREGSVKPGQPWTPLTPQEIAEIGRKHGVIFAPTHVHDSLHSH
jgi:quercetin dioxygenase-like cupin family protein